MKVTRFGWGVLAFAILCGGAAAQDADCGASIRGGILMDRGGVDVLSDTQGVNFDRYVKHVLKRVYKQWRDLMPEEALAPQCMHGETDVRFTISRDGTVTAMHEDKSAAEEKLNEAARGAIKSAGKFPALPKEFHGPSVELKIHFLVNEDGGIPATATRL
jgi:TonB family protein